MAASERAAPVQPLPSEGERELDWAVPSCPLTYHYRGVLTAGAANIVLEFDLRMTARDEGVALHAQTITTSQTLNGAAFGQPRTQAEGSLADVHLAREPGVWVEVDGPTKMWSAFDSAPSLVLMWPALPARREPGATAEWTIVGNHQNPEVARTEAARGSLELPEGWEPAEYEPEEPGINTVKLESWEQGPGGKLTLAVDEKFELPASETTPSVTMRQVGRYEVLTTGILVRAEVEITFEAEGSEATQVGELRLTRGCDEP